jgi:hypothetical protein
VSHVVSRKYTSTNPPTTATSVTFLDIPVISLSQRNSNVSGQSCSLHTLLRFSHFLHPGHTWLVSEDSKSMILRRHHPFRTTFRASKPMGRTPTRWMRYSCPNRTSLSDKISRILHKAVPVNHTSLQTLATSWGTPSQEYPKVIPHQKERTPVHHTSHTLHKSEGPPIE